MRIKTLSKALGASSSTIAQLHPIAKVLQRNRDAGSSPELLREAAVYGVRDAKKRLSSLLNDATSGAVTFIEAGQGGTVVLIGTDTLADLFVSLEETRDMTLGAA